MVTFFYFSLPIPWTWFQVVLSVFRWLPKSTLARCARGFILNNDDAHNTPGLKGCRKCTIMRQKPFYILIYIPKPPVVVCKRWERLTGDDTLWKRLDLGLAAVPAGACWVNGSCTFSQSFYIVNHLKVSLAQSCQGVALYCGWLGRLWLKIFSLLRSQTRSGDKSD